MDYLNSIKNKITPFISPLGIEFDKQYLDYILTKTDTTCTVQQLIKVLLENNKLNKSEYVIHIILIVLILNNYKYNKEINKSFSLSLLVQHINSIFDNAYKHKCERLKKDGNEILDKMKLSFTNYDYILSRSELDYLPCLLSSQVIESKINKIINHSQSEYIIISDSNIEVPFIYNGICIELDSFLFSYDEKNRNLIEVLINEENETTDQCITIHFIHWSVVSFPSLIKTSIKFLFFSS